MAEQTHLVIDQVKKSYRTKEVLKGISFDCKPGQITGLIGKNGSGKTTLFHSILHFLDYEGKITLNGQVFSSADYNIVGYLPEERSLMPKLTVLEQVRYLASLKGMSNSDIKAALPAWMEKLQVVGKMSDKIKSLSKGNQQKIQMIATMIHQPQILILDEPFSGLDPVNVDLMKDIILDQAKRGATVIFSDHNMDNVERLCDKVVMINHGQLVLNGTIQEIRDSYPKEYLYLKKAGLNREQVASLPGCESFVQRHDGVWAIKLTDEKYGPEIFDLLSHGEYIQTFSQEAPTLDQIFKMEAAK
ncbi:ABC transporter ATP-binding protein [Lactobacillus psittaci]|uniref:ABC transporter ATPase component n=1 Tax=Lactobacillus psittaci DSM 15354 TaxID=1122152 RepID=A0A0R1S084_9LACO|nr:ABC transporter ATP-binding protein [Lactobacillus psittaci]KRL62551.1 ABC transporter ATPase component [Lactobacillus psittaci DSM 15354]